MYNKVKKKSQKFDNALLFVVRNILFCGGFDSQKEVQPTPYTVVIHESREIRTPYLSYVYILLTNYSVIPFMVSRMLRPKPLHAITVRDPINEQTVT